MTFSIYDAKGHAAVKARIAARKRMEADKLEQEANAYIERNPEKPISAKGSKTGTLKFTKEPDYEIDDRYQDMMDKVDKLREEANLL